MSGIRSKDDVKWQELKKFISKRDKNKCRFLSILSIKDFKRFEKLWGLSHTLDRAHVFPVSSFPELTYIPENVYLLNRVTHHFLDDCKDPITGDLITREERDQYWIKIIGQKNWDFLESKKRKYESKIEEENRK